MLRNSILMVMMPFFCLYFPGEASSQVLVGYEDITEVTSSEISIRFGGFVDKNIHDIQVVRIHYKTKDYTGKEVKASGVILIPMTSGPFTMISQQHGTIQGTGPAPSNYSYGSEIYSFGSLLASSGYIVVAADYLGYGDSRHIPHPYEHAGLLASACNDLLLASNEYCIKNEITLTKNLLLTGYSEGGFASLALHRFIESLDNYPFTLKGSAPASGAYDKRGFATYILTQDREMHYINYYLWVLDTYNKIYNINRHWGYYLNPPYDKAVLKNGPVYGQVCKNPNLLFTERFRQGVLQGTDADFLKALDDNTLINWAPKAPVLLIHGTEDDFVPYFNTLNAYKSIKGKGGNVYLRDIDGGDHSSSFSEYYRAVLNFVDDKK